MYQRIDELEKITAIAGKYYHAMIDGNDAHLKDVFHPRASIIGNFGGELEFSGLEDFIASTVDAKTGDGPFEYRMDDVKLIGDTAVVTVGGYCYGTWITDHLSFVKIGGKWQIVAKTFYAEPSG